MEKNNNQSFISIQFNALLAFIKKPQYISSADTFAQKLKTFCVLFFMNIIMVGFLMMILSLVESFLPESIMDGHKVGQMFNDSPTWVIFLLAAVLAPLWEELMFRFPLYYRRWIIDVLFAVLLLFGIKTIVDSVSLVPKIIIGTILLIFLVLYIVFNRRVVEYFRQLWQNRFPVVFYIFTFLFALIHITNYTISWLVLLLIPILVLPQFAIGVFLGYVRVRLGIAWSIIFHAVHNGLFVGLATVAMLMVFTPIDVKTDSYSLKINKTDSGELEDALSKVAADTVTITNHSFKACLAMLIDKEEKFIETDEDKEGVKLDILFINKSKKEASQTAIENNKKTILKEMKKAYGFTFDTILKTVPYYEVYVKDAVKLEKYKGISGKTSMTTLKHEEVSLENTGVAEIISALNNKNKDAEFVTNINSKQTYTLNYPVLSIEETEQYFEKHFGLGFKKSEKEVEVIEVVFEGM